MATMKKEITPMIHAKTKFHDRALSCGNHTFLSYDCPAILQRGGDLCCHCKHIMLHGLLQDQGLIGDEGLQRFRN